MGRYGEASSPDKYSIIDMNARVLGMFQNGTTNCELTDSAVTY